MRKKVFEVLSTSLLMALLITPFVFMSSSLSVKAEEGSPYGPSYGPKVEEEEEKEEKREESSSSSSRSDSTPEPTPAQRAEITRNEQGVVGSKAYAEQQAKVESTINTAVARIAVMTPEQVAVVKNTGLGVNMGGCTTFSPSLVRTIAANNTIPYNVGFTWSGINFTIKLPAGINMTDFMSPDGSVQMWRLVQKYGIALALPVAK
ncbi:MAG: hypothetical protein Q4E51_06555 [Lachnospiraceae bacterium]|nr:hypothetical protein [Lachnospiraceae bacterium]